MKLIRKNHMLAILGSSTLLLLYFYFRTTPFAADTSETRTQQNYSRKKIGLFPPKMGTTMTKVENGEVKLQNSNQQNYQMGTLNETQIQACLNLWDNIQQWTPSKGPLPTNEKCDKTPVSLSAYHLAYQSYCKDFFLNNFDKPVSPDCRVAKNAYRIKFVYFLTQNTPLSEITDSEMLKERIFAEVTHFPPNATLVAKRLVELNPNSEEASKLLLSTSIAETYFSPMPPGDPHWNALRQLASDLKSNLSEDSTELKEMDAMTAIYGANSISDAVRAAQYIAVNSESPGLGFYYLAKRQAEQGHIGEASHFMKQALDQEPNQFKYSAMLAQLTGQNKNEIRFSYATPFESVLK